MILLRPKGFLIVLMFIACSKAGDHYMQSTNFSLQDTGRAYLALGDSYTIGESVSVNDRYPVQLVKLLRENNIQINGPEIIAATGWTTADLLSAINNYRFSQTYDIVTLLIGVNNQYQGRNREEYKDQFTNLVQKAIQLAGNRPSHVVVLSIPDYSITPFAHDRDTASIAKQIDSFNIINKTVADTYKVHYINVTDESRKAAHDPSLIASDGLHFSGK